MFIYDRFCRDHRWYRWGIWVSRNRLPRHANKLVQEPWARSLFQRFSPADFEFVRHLAQCLCRTPTFSQRLRGTIGTIQRSNAPTFGETTGSLANGEIEDMISENREHFAKCSPFQSLMWSCSMWFASCEWDKPG